MRRSFVSLFVGIALAVIAVFLMTQYRGEGIVSHPANEEGRVRIVVASKDLDFGTKLIRDHLAYAEWPEESVPETAFTDMKVLLESEDGGDSERIVLRGVFKGEPLIKQKVSGYGNKPTLSRKVARDKRAFSIRINDVNGVAGFLMPGDKVDVMLTRAPSGSRGGENLVTDVILQNVVILGIDQLINESAEKPVVAKTATVEVDADQAQKLALAQQIGTLSLTLRNYSDNQEVSVGRVSTADLAGPPKKAASEGGHVVRIRRGTAVDYSRMP